MKKYAYVVKVTIGRQNEEFVQFTEEAFDFKNRAEFSCEDVAKAVQKMLNAYLLEVQ